MRSTRVTIWGAAQLPTPTSSPNETPSTPFAAARDGDFGTLVAVLDLDVVLRAGHGAVPGGHLREVRGAAGGGPPGLVSSPLG